MSALAAGPSFESEADPLRLRLLTNPLRSDPRSDSDFAKSLIFVGRSHARIVLDCLPTSMRAFVTLINSRTFDRSECGQGLRQGLTSEERSRMKEPERENRELRRVNEILRLASAFFERAELDRNVK